LEFSADFISDCDRHIYLLASYPQSKVPEIFTMLPDLPNFVVSSFKTSFEVFSFGTIFPLAFGIKTAFQNRERAAGALSRIKATVLSLFLVFQVRPTQDQLPPLPSNLSLAAFNLSLGSCGNEKLRIRSLQR
jgi:hypothetical protein